MREVQKPSVGSIAMEWTATEARQQDSQTSNDNGQICVSSIIQKMDAYEAFEANLQTLLSVTKITASKPAAEANEGVEAHMFLDSGSETSYITESLAKRLGLDNTDSETLAVYTFGS